MKKSDTNFVPSRSSAGLKLILKVGNTSTSTLDCSNEDSLQDGFLSNNEDQRCLRSLSPDQYMDDVKRHKKNKKKKRKKDKHEKKKHHHKEKKKHFELPDKSITFNDLSKQTVVTNTDTFGNSLSSSCVGITSHSISTTENNINSEKGDRSPLQKLLDYIQDNLERRDTRHFFKWPVTDQIAPGYSNVISHPMDLTTMKKKINRSGYKTLTDYLADFKLMCKNAMIYNHPETIYYKAAKKLLHFGLKITNRDRLQSLQAILPFLSEVTPSQLGFNITPSGDELTDVTKPESGLVNENTTLIEDNESIAPEDILSQVEDACMKIHGNRKKPKMGFLKQSDDGFTTLQILVPNEGINKETRERPVLLGSLVGKSNHGSNTWQPFKEDKRNAVKPVKPLNYGSFGSYAPSYDSTFANITKEETDLLFQTYGDETAVQYAESVLNFAKDNDYTTVMVDNLLDIMTSGEHRKTKKILNEKRKEREKEDEEEHKVFQTNSESSATTHSVSSSTPASANNDTAASTLALDRLKSLAELGIDTSFLDYYEELFKEEQQMKNKLSYTKSLIEKLHQVQNERLNNPTFSLQNVATPSEAETQLADKVTENLKSIIRKVPPSLVAPTNSIRKALGISAPSAPESSESSEFYNQQISNNIEENSSAAETNRVTSSGTGTGGGPMSNILHAPGIDLESELREFLESDTELSHFELSDDDKTIEQMLSESS